MMNSMEKNQMTKWTVDPDHSAVEFSVTHLLINRIKGMFEQFEAAVDFDPERPASLSIAASITANSLTTRLLPRDEHLKSSGFLDVDQYPEITFRSTGCTPIDGRKYELAGELTLHGITKPVIFRTELIGFNNDPRGRRRAGFHAEARIERSSFGLTFDSPLETGGIVVAEEIKIELDIEAVRIEQLSEASEQKLEA